MSQSPEAMKVWREARRAWHSRPLTPHENGSVSLGHSEAAASVIEAALQKARDEERAAVVVWLEAENKRAQHGERPATTWKKCRGVSTLSSVASTGGKGNDRSAREGG